MLQYVRRYADVMVHRLLAAALGIQALPSAAHDRDTLRATCANLNVRHRGAQMAGRASVELHTLIFFRARTIVADARIIKVSARKEACLVFVEDASPKQRWPRLGHCGGDRCKVCVHTPTAWGRAL